MLYVKRAMKFLSVFAVLASPVVTSAQHYTQKNLLSDISQPNNADGSKVGIDPNLKNPWGLTRSSGSPWWVGNNNSGTSTLYDGNGNFVNLPDQPGGQTANFITVPSASTTKPPVGTPTGAVFNGSTTDFLLVPGKTGTQAVFIFVTEDGTISGWNPGVNVTPGAKISGNAVIVVDNSDNGGADGAVYKGATTADIDGQRFLYVANFRNGKVEVYDTNFKPVHLGNHRDDDAFDDDDIPFGFAPFNVQNVGGSLFVTYAKQDAAKHDPVGGDGLGFVDIYSPTGHLEGRLQHGDWMNAPWGVVWTPRDFGEFSNTILVGNFRSGWIAAFNGFTHRFIGFVKNPDDSLVTIDGLWALVFGNGATAGPATTLYFTAGINGEADGLFGTLTPVSSEQDGDEL
ncbi:MAG TPA: TIGR03118 family protein [Candidatus Dormibacteraeota bacterium]|nr:TIGR03118 family protein [Candidatus Dormibacteraeota bacterium]